MNQDLVRLDRFDGSNFTRWQYKVRFLLTTLKIFCILDPALAPLPEQKKNDAAEVVAKGRRRRRTSSYVGVIFLTPYSIAYMTYTLTLISQGRVGRLLKTSTKPRKKVPKSSLFLNTLISIIFFLMKSLSYYKFMSYK